MKINKCFWHNCLKLNAHLRQEISTCLREVEVFVNRPSTTDIAEGIAVIFIQMIENIIYQQIQANLAAKFWADSIAYAQVIGKEVIQTTAQLLCII